jgi:hypothetical protein
MSQGRTSILEPALLLWIILLVLMLRLILTVANVPKIAITMGVSTIAVEENCFAGLGQNKADIIKNNSGRHQR